ncbi:Zn-ribbon domain-containing OB-fold protein [Streptomyces sp. NBC_00370]|uniref:Zn-ribbon domain-containing OB-fold protein n=1 Tax=Streptomyces sp. NBC_00370 TaxID=2975728 RepID=UPI002E254FC0
MADSHTTPERESAPEPAPEPGLPPKPLPTVDEHNEPFWTGAAHGTLRMQRCLDCGHIRFPIQPLCPRCISGRLEWTDLSGRGEVFSKAVYRRAFHPAYRADVPYNLVIVQLAEGPRMFSNVVGEGHETAAVGDPLQVVFDRVADGIHIPRFRRLPAAD